MKPLPLTSSFLMSVFTILIFCGQSLAVNFLFASMAGLSLAHYYVAAGNPFARRLHFLRYIAFMYAVFLSPFYRITVVSGGFLSVLTILRILDGHHFANPRRTFHISLVMVAFGMLHGQGAALILYLPAWFMASESFVAGCLTLGGSKKVTLSRHRLSSVRRTGFLPALFRVSAFSGEGILNTARMAFLASVIFILLPRINTGFNLSGRGMSPYSSSAISLNELDNLILDNSVVMRVKLSREANVYHRGRSFNIYSTITRRWFSMPLPDKKVESKQKGGLTVLPSFHMEAGRKSEESNFLASSPSPPDPGTGEILIQEYYLSSRLAGAFFSVYRPLETDYPSETFLSDDLENHIPLEPAGSSVHYTVKSRILPPGPPGIEKLSALSPAEIAYLQVPRGLERLVKLAREIAEPYESALDRARAINAYLKNNYSYTLNPAEPPGYGNDEMDPVEKFLFSTRQGHCELFASAMVLMLRAVNIPARLTAGFTGGEYNRDGGYYIIRGRDAHAWVEAYFRGYGWYQFDPTGFRSSSDNSDTFLKPLAKLREKFDFFFESYVNCYNFNLSQKFLELANGIYRKIVSTVRDMLQQEIAPLQKKRVIWLFAFLFSVILPVLFILFRREIITWFSGKKIFLISRASVVRTMMGYSKYDFMRFLLDELQKRNVFRRKPSMTHREMISILSSHLSSQDVVEFLERIVELYYRQEYSSRKLESREILEGWKLSGEVIKKAWK